MLFVQIFIFFYPIIILISDGIVGIKPVLLLVQIIFIFALSLYLFFRKPKVKKNFSRQSKIIHTLIIIFLGVNIVSCIRGFFNGLIPETALIFNIINLVFFYLVSRFAVVLEEKEKITSSLFLGILFYCLVEISLFYSPLSKQLSIFNYENVDSNNALSNLFGFQSERIALPLASFSWGATHSGAIVGILFVASCISLMYTKPGNNGRFYKPRSRDFFRLAILCLCIAISFWIIVLADSRAAFLACFVSVLTFLFLRLLLTHSSLIKLLLKYISQIFISFYLFSFLFMYLKDFFAYIIETAGMYRGNNKDTFSNRDIIWEVVIKFFAEFSPDHIIGYGMWGQYVTGINIYYENLLFSTNTYYSLHSTILQNLIDTGYLGIFVYIYLTFVVLKSSKTIFFETMCRKSDYPQPDFSIFSSGANFGVLFYLIMIGSSDSLITMERLLSINIYLVLAMSSLTLVPSRQYGFQILKNQNHIGSIGV